MSLLLDEHREYLSDRPRVDAFRRAIHNTVRPGDIVLDLACGTGILGLMACEAGASRVYAIDDSGMIEIARAVARHNGLDGRITHFFGHSAMTSLPERADVLVFDQIGRLGFDAGLMEMAADARRRLLKPDARIVPAAVTLEIALAASPTVRERVEFWKTHPAGIDFSPAFATAVNTGYPLDDDRAALMSAAKRAATFEPSRWSGEGFASEFELVASASGRADGLLGWFHAELADGVAMTNSPLAASRINRRPGFLPFERPLDVAEGERLGIGIRVLPAESLLSWHVARADGSDSLRQSTWKGFLPAHEELQRTRPGAVPSLTKHGQARKTVLDLCDGRRTVREIEAIVAERHPDLFLEPHAAAVFVAEVLSVYARP